MSIPTKAPQRFNLLGKKIMFAFQNKCNYLSEVFRVANDIAIVRENDMPVFSEMVSSSVHIITDRPERTADYIDIAERILHPGFTKLSVTASAPGESIDTEMVTDIIDSAGNMDNLKNRDRIIIVDMTQMTDRNLKTISEIMKYASDPKNTTAPHRLCTHAHRFVTLIFCCPFLDAPDVSYRSPNHTYDEHLVAAVNHHLDRYTEVKSVILDTENHIDFLYTADDMGFCPIAHAELTGGPAQFFMIY